MTFAPPLDPRAMLDDERLRHSVRAALAELERRCDPVEAARAQPSAYDDDAAEARGDVRARLQ